MDLEEILTNEEGESLLRLAEYALQASQGRLCFYPKIETSQKLQQIRGLFVGLWKGSELRGCIGSLNPGKPLIESVVDLSMKSCLKDPRFPPIENSELPFLKLEISVLSKPMPISFSEIEIGKHGLIVAEENKVGLLLPFVAKENNWDAETFLIHTCFKGSLPADAWKSALVLGFEVQIFRNSCHTEIDS